MMNQDEHDRQEVRQQVGLCIDCRHSRAVVSQRGSRFYLCGLADSDPHFVRYPALPVIRCAGYEPAGAQMGRK